MTIKKKCGVHSIRWAEKERGVRYIKQNLLSLSPLGKKLQSAMTAFNKLGKRKGERIGSESKGEGREGLY